MFNQETRIGGIIFSLFGIAIIFILNVSPYNDSGFLPYNPRIPLSDLKVHNSYNPQSDFDLNDITQRRNYRKFKNGSIDTRIRPDHIQILQNSNESFAFYVIAGKEQNLNPDLRGKYWEFQLDHFGGKSNVIYLSDGPLKVNGIEFQVLPPSMNNSTFEDKKLCIRTPATFHDFVDHFGDTRWYFRGTHDTFINLTGLVLLTHELEEKFGDPMKTFSAAFNFHEWNHILYPQGGTGWLFSNAAIRELLTKESRFSWYCQGSADDIAIANYMSEIGHDPKQFQDKRFIVTWPNTEGHVIYHEKWAQQKKCPEHYYLWDEAPGLDPCPVTSAVSIHMHRVPMDEAWRQFLMVPDGIAVYFPNPNLPLFCRL